MSFIQHFFEAQGQIIGPGENQVLCPFPHAVSGGGEYSESRPSASYNSTKGVYHCKSCGRGLNEVQFIEQYFGCDSNTARRLADCFHATEETLAKWDTHTDGDGLIDLEQPLNEETKARAQALGISDRAIRLMHIKTKIHSGWSNILAFPIDMYDAILEHKYYHPYDETHPKTDTSKKFWTRGGCPTGLIYPWRIFEECSEKSILCICAGEKDTANMLERGFQAVTVHGGEQTYKIVCPNLFKNKSIAILYDNDQAGINGARKLATFLYEHGCTRIRVVTGHHNICTEEHEDITDFFQKYKRTDEELKDIIRGTPLFVPEEEDYNNINSKNTNTALIKTKIPTITLYEATQPEHENKLVKSLIQVLASEDSAYSIPTSAVVRKIKEARKVEEHHWQINQYKEWELTPSNCEDVLRLVDENFTTEEILANIKKYFAHADPKESGIVVDILKRGVAFRATVQDYIEDKSIEFKSQIYDALVFDTKLDSGKKYMITYKVVSHDYKGARKTMIISSVEDAEDSLSSFNITPTVIKNLVSFQGKTVEQIMRSFAPYIGFTPNLQLLKTIDLAFHTPLQFYLTNQFNKPQLIRGTLDTLIVGESRIGKAQPLTSKCLTQTGWKQFKDLQIGEEVINGTTGQPTKILEIKDWPKDDVYRITFTDGTHAECHGNHEWTLKNAKQDFKREHRDAHLPPYEITLKTKEIMSRSFKDYYLPTLPLLDLPEKEFIIDPHMLGLFIGNKENYICITENVIYSNEIHRLKLDVHPASRFIPEKYMWSSHAQRQALLRGIMNGKASYSTYNKRLIYGIQQLSLSLGLKASITEHQIEGKYTVYTHSCPKRFIKNIEKIGQEPTRCISIDDPRGLYITDDFIITHNSATTKTAIEVYGLGQIISLAGKSATINGLIGGSIKVGSSDRYATKAGVLPMNHKGLVILEELGKATADLMRELTEIRSSNRVRITRVDNTVDLPCMLRMMYLTNPKSRDGETQSVESFPHGIEIVTGLVAAPEDIARFDNICIIGDKANVDYTKLEETIEGYSVEAYRDRIRWIWSRKPEQIIITKEADLLLRQLCNKLNGIYETHIKIFGTELRHKIARIAVAIASYLVSTDGKFETILVLPTHVNEAADYFRSLYDNPTFKLMQYVNEQKQYSEVTESGIATLESTFNKKNGAPLLYALDQRSVCTLNELMASTGTTRDDLNVLLQPLLKACMIQFSDQNKIRPTEKYRLTRPKIQSNRVREISDERGDGS